MILNKKIPENEATSTRDNSTLMLRMVTSYSIFLLIILILFLFLYRSSFNNMRTLYNLQNRSTLISNVELFEKDLDIMDVYCRQLIQNNSFRRVANTHVADNTFRTLATEISTSLATDVYPETLLPISEVYVYLPLTDYILAPTYAIRQDRYYDWVKRYDLDLYSQWDEYLNNEKYYYQFLPINNLLPTSTVESYMYIINIEDLHYLNTNAVVCFVFTKDELASLFECMSPSSLDNILLITDTNDNVVLTLNNEALNNETSINSHNILSLDYSNDLASYQGNGYRLSIGRYTSANTGNTYYYSYAPFENSSNTLVARIIFPLVFGLCLIGGSFMVLTFSRKNVQPIIELGHELDEAVEAQNYLQEMVDNQRPIICNSYVRQLLTGTVASEEELAYIKEYLELYSDSLYYNVLYVVVYNNHGDSQETPSVSYGMSDEFNEIISTALQEFFGLPLYCFSPSDRTFALLLNCNAAEEKDFIIKIGSVVSQLHDYLLDTYGIWLFAGVGKNTNSLSNVWESYQQAVDAASYTTKNYIFFPYEFIKKDSNAFYYPPELSTKLIHFITSGNTAQVVELFSLIHQENIEERSLPVNLLKFLLSDIRNTLLKARFALPANVDPEIVQSIDERFNEHFSFRLCEDIALTLSGLFTTTEEDDTLASTIEKYILKNYKDPSLCLNKISDEFQISESYFSHMFKEKTGVNFSTYLENIRINEAARLIRETDTSLNELYIAVGYNNANTFRRAFKKIYGVTPSSLRENK